MRIKTFLLAVLCLFCTFALTSHASARTWDLTSTMTATLDDGVLTFNTTLNVEAMPDYDSPFDVPWRVVRDYITSVIITDGVTTIGQYSLWHCDNLASVTIGNSVTTVSDESFTYCTSLASITIPASVRDIGYAVFSGCSALTGINVDAENPYWTSDDGVLYNKSKSLLYICPAGKSGAFTIPSFVTEIGSGAFSHCVGITSITIPASVMAIGFCAFNDCTGLTSVTIPASVRDIGDAVFLECSALTEINVEAGNPYWTSDDGVLYNKSKSFLHTCPAGKSGAYTISSSVTEIGYSAFNDCIGLTSVTIPNSVTSIGEWAFGHCTGLTSVTIPNSVTSIGEWAFEFCTLTNITVSWPTPLDIPLNTFYYFHNLLDIEVSLPNCTLHVPRGTEALYSHANIWKYFNITASGNSIGAEAVGSLREVTILGNTLSITSTSAEQVEIYSMTGALLYNTSKATGEANYNIGNLPKGVLIVRGSSGWIQKIIKP